MRAVPTLDSYEQQDVTCSDKKINLEKIESNKKKEAFIIFAAYNEEKTLPSAFLSAEKSAEYASKFYDMNFKAIICHNGCTDNTPQVAQDMAKNAKIQVDVISSNKGMVIAQNKCIEHILQIDSKAPVIFVDADCIMNENVIKLYLEQFEKHPNLQAVGAHPLPISKPDTSKLTQLKHHILNFRAYHPQSQVAKIYSPQHHPYAKSDPQPVGWEFEEKSKTYFHGRCFALREAQIWDVPSDAISEDIYLDCTIHQRFGPGSIRQLYHANVYFNPIDSLRAYLRTYSRIYQDKDDLMKNPDFRKQLEYSQTKLSLDYFLKADLSTKFLFTMYLAIEKLGKSFINTRFIENKAPKDLWAYNTKEELRNENCNTSAKA